MMTKGNNSSKGLSKKSRAPDLCCVLTTSNSQCRRVIVEVTVTNRGRENLTDVQLQLTPQDGVTLTEEEVRVVAGPA